MDIYVAETSLAGSAGTDVHDLTSKLTEAVGASGFSNGLATVFVPGSTAGVTTIEFESGVVEDFKAALERLAPSDLPYAHDSRWGDGNGYAHVRAALLGSSLSVPIRDGRLALGTWQQVVLVDFDNRPRRRRVVFHLLGRPSSAPKTDNQA